MKKTVISTLALLLFGGASAFDLAQVAPGVQFTTAKAEARKRLFTDSKPLKSIFHLGKKDSVIGTTIEITPDHELLIVPEKGRTDAKFSVRLAVPKCDKAQLSFSIKTTAFCARNKANRSQYNHINIYAGGVNLTLRGDTRDLRYFNREAKKYVRAFVVKDGEWSKVTIDITCGANPIFSLNELKDLPQRGKCEYIRLLAFSGRFPLAKENTSVAIKDLKFTVVK